MQSFDLIFKKLNLFSFKRTTHVIIFVLKFVFQIKTCYNLLRRFRIVKLKKLYFVVC